VSLFIPQVLEIEGRAHRSARFDKRSLAKRLRGADGIMVPGMTSGRSG